MRIYLFWPEVRALRSPTVRRELERQTSAAAILLILVGWTNSNMLWYIAFGMLNTNLDLNINTWVQHSFINYDDGTCNPWNSTTLAHDQLTWSGCAEHLKHHLRPTQSQEAFIEWYKSPEGVALRKKYGFHVFEAKTTGDYYRLFYAIIMADYSYLESVLVAENGQPAKGLRTAVERAHLMQKLELQLGRSFAPVDFSQ